MSDPISMALNAEAPCLVCGQRVSVLEAALHAEDHAQRGEYPPPPNLCPACSLDRHEICSRHISPCSCKDPIHG